MVTGLSGGRQPEEMRYTDAIMSSRIRTFDSSVGSKLLIGLTGLALFLYLVTHIAGNVLVFLGADTFNAYAHTLSSNPLIPVIEVGLVLVFLLHIVKTITMFTRNKAARPVGYAVKKSAGGPSRKTLASSTMIVSGLWLLVFIVLHVQAFRYGLDYETAGGVRDLYRVEMETFASPLTVGFYVLTMMIVGSHLWHGAASAFQSLGADHPKFTPVILVIGKAAAVVIAGGFIVIALWAHFVGGAR
jgi:succinate dehydrogenase / fumarate reductase, cytochrome b subunit